MGSCRDSRSIFGIRRHGRGLATALDGRTQSTDTRDTSTTCTSVGATGAISKAIHQHLAHLTLDSFAHSVRLTMPAMLGAEHIIKIVNRALEVAGYTVQRSARDPEDRSVQLLADEWPEYVLGPDNPLTFLSPEMKCTFFGV
jgi:hypothetical protein